MQFVSLDTILKVEILLLSVSTCRHLIDDYVPCMRGVNYPVVSEKNFLNSLYLKDVQTTGDDVRQVTTITHLILSGKLIKTMNIYSQI